MEITSKSNDLFDENAAVTSIETYICNEIESFSVSRKQQKLNHNVDR